MTRKDYELIAKTIKYQLGPMAYSLSTEAEEERTRALHSMAYALSEALHDTNPRFDQARFLEACGVV